MNVIVGYSDACKACSKAPKRRFPWVELRYGSALELEKEMKIK
jgi:hypothetical protein